jgi:hypothetical protein
VFAQHLKALGLIPCTRKKKKKKILRVRRNCREYCVWSPWKALGSMNPFKLHAKKLSMFIFLSSHPVTIRFPKGLREAVTHLSRPPLFYQFVAYYNMENTKMSFPVPNPSPSPPSHHLISVCTCVILHLLLLITRPHCPPDSSFIS